jgi:hypothetical protein
LHALPPSSIRRSAHHVLDEILERAHRRGKATTFVAALRLDRIDAPAPLERPIDGESFRASRAKMTS